MPWIDRSRIWWGCLVILSKWRMRGTHTALSANISTSDTNLCYYLHIMYSTMILLPFSLFFSFLAFEHKSNIYRWDFELRPNAVSWPSGWGNLCKPMKMYHKTQKDRSLRTMRASPCELPNRWLFSANTRSRVQALGPRFSYLERPRLRSQYSGKKKLSGRRTASGKIRRKTTAIPSHPTVSNARYRDIIFQIGTSQLGPNHPSNDTANRLRRRQRAMHCTRLGVLRHLGYCDASDDPSPGIRLFHSGDIGIADPAYETGSISSSRNIDWNAGSALDRTETLFERTAGKKWIFKLWSHTPPLTNHVSVGYRSCIFICLVETSAIWPATIRTDDRIRGLRALSRPLPQNSIIYPSSWAWAGPMGST